MYPTLYEKFSCNYSSTQKWLNLIKQNTLDISNLFCLVKLINRFLIARNLADPYNAKFMERTVTKYLPYFLENVNLKVSKPSEISD